MELFNLLLSEGPLKAGQLGKRSGLNRTSVYDIVRKLIAKGVVRESLQGGTKVFSLFPPDKIELLIKEKEDALVAAHADIRLLQTEYAKRSQLFKPRFQIFEGREELQQMMKDMLLHRSVTVYAYWPIKKVIEVLGSDFLLRFHRERVANDIALKTIWPHEHINTARNHPYLNIGPSWKREVRIAPRSIGFSLGYAIYDNTVRFISSRKENMGFLAESYELAETMKGQFQVLWDISKPITDKRAG